MKNIYNFLSSKKAAWLFTIIAIACRVVNILYASFTSRDKIFLALQSKSFLNGEGLSVPQYFTTNIMDPIYDLTLKWPPGYPILLAPFLKIFDYDVAAATAAIDLAGGMALIFITRSFANHLTFPPAAVNIITLIAGCFEYAFISEALPTDIPSFALFLWGLLLLLKTVQKETLQINKILVASLLLFLPCTFRYSYPPLSIAAPLGIILIGWYLEKKLFIKKGVLSLAIISLLMILLFIFLKTTTGNAGYIVDTGKGFYPENILHCAPIVPGSFINTFFTTSQLINKTGITLSQSHQLLEIVNALMIVGLVILFFYLFRKKFFKPFDPFRLFLLTGFFISTATFVSLGYLAVTYKPQIGFEYGWNYFNEPRYFMFVSFYLQVGFIGWIFLYHSWKQSMLQKIIVALFSLLLVIEVTHNIYFNAKVALDPVKYQVAPYEETDYTYFTQTLSSLSRENTDADFLIVSGSDDFFPLMAAYAGHKGIYDGQNIHNTLPQIKKKTIIIFTLYDNELPAYQEFLTNQNAVVLNKINGVNFYSVTLER
ncbi:MAG TPA: hypothetical protein VFH08_10980 [Chitinophagaceae bacterium]|nr:hypothetical protein [Chitinophagaceae bacterium]